MKPPVPTDEDERLRSLLKYDILDTLAEQDFDELTMLASHICETPIALISLVDSHRQWFKSKVGLTVCETPRELAFCSYTILGDVPLVVPDAELDTRFSRNPLVTGEPKIRFYAGAPLVTPDGHRLGSLCVIDQKPRKLSEAQLRSLKALARQVVFQLELRDKLTRLDHNTQETEGLKNQIGDARRQLEETSATTKAVKSDLNIFQFAVENSSDAVFWIKADGSFSNVNQKASDYLGYSKEELCQMTVSDINPAFPIESWPAHWKETKDSGVNTFESVHRRKDGSTYDCAITKHFLDFEGSEVIFATARDISEQKRAKNALIESARLAEESRRSIEASEFALKDAVLRRDEFLAMLSHELRNPLAAIMNSLVVLEISDPLKSPQQGVIAREVIGRQAIQLSKLLDDLLDVSRIAYGKISLNLEPIDLVALAREVVECIESRLLEKNQNLTLSMPHLPVFINGDASRVLQAQVNLLVNAIKYTPENGQIRFSIAVQGESAVIDVEDDGDGISSELLQEIFDIFVQADQPLDRNVGGMGLGLPLVKMIAKAHQGEIKAKSRGPGKGSHFTLTLPLLSEQDKPAKPIDSSVAKTKVDHHRDQKLMLVEDNDDSRKMLSIFLESVGYDVACARNGLEAVKIFHQLKPAVCIVDIGLPDLNGYEVAKKIRMSEFQPKLLAALTGYGQAHDREKVASAGFDLHIVKPINPNDLIETIDNFLASISPS